MPRCNLINRVVCIQECESRSEISGRGKHGENSSEFGWVIHLQGWETDDADRGRTLREGWVLRRVGGDVGDVEGQIYAE